MLTPHTAPPGRERPSLAQLVAEMGRLYARFKDVAGRDGLDRAEDEVSPALGQGKDAVYSAPLATVADAAALLHGVLLWGGPEMEPDDAKQIERVADYLEREAATAEQQLTDDVDSVLNALVEAARGKAFVWQGKDTGGAPEPRRISMVRMEAARRLDGRRRYDVTAYASDSANVLLALGEPTLEAARTAALAALAKLPTAEPEPSP